ncbi:hypothetical protein [Aliagarivorans taiwanensis]|uniref:hypothetical protein n=1 Tax=Aliagarivorans taiwanensis TaxID=561966 RepID=UPI00047DD4AB|nr:hypothetical protein [Aliagarivorans taiwanensis]
MKKTQIKPRAEVIIINDAKTIAVLQSIVDHLCTSMHLDKDTQWTVRMSDSYSVHYLKENDLWVGTSIT